MSSPSSPVSTRRVLQIYLQRLSRYPFLAIGVPIAVIAAQLVELAGPLYYKKFLDALSNTNGAAPEKVFTVAFGILLIILGLNLLHWLISRLNNFGTCILQPKVMTDLDQSSFAYLIRHSYQFFSNSFSGSLVRKLNRLSRSFEDIHDVFVGNFLPLIVSLIGILYVVSKRSTTIAIGMAIWIVVFLVVNYFFSIWKLRFDTLRAQKDSEVTGTLSDAITNSTNIKLFTGYGHENTLYQKVTNQLRRMRTFGWVLGTVSDSVQMLVMIVLEFFVLFFALRLWKQGVFTLGDFGLLQGYLLTLFHQLNGVRRIIRRLYESFADASEMVEILDTPHEIQDRRNAKALAVNRGAINFQNVTFRYHKKSGVLNNFNLAIKPHEKIALVGTSGAGKSTVVKILFRFYDLNRGKILIDGQSIRDVTQESLHEQISLVPQEPILFHRSLFENIRYGRRDATLEEVFEAARKAHCHEFIMHSPQGYETLVGERGIKLSGGERQRVAIARAILKNAPILVLDEATSSLDSESEALIQDALHTLMADKTVIVIAHRLSTIMQMDRIVVMENGSVVETGTHAKLLQKTGIYQKLWEIQAGGFLG